MYYMSLSTGYLKLKVGPLEQIFSSPTISSTFMVNLMFPILVSQMYTHLKCVTPCNRSTGCFQDVLCHTVGTESKITLKGLVTGYI